MDSSRTARAPLAVTGTWGRYSSRQSNGQDFHWSKIEKNLLQKSILRILKRVHFQGFLITPSRFFLNAL